MYSVRSAEELKAGVVMVLGVMVVGLDEADPDEVADATVVTPLLSTDLLLKLTVITAVYQHQRRMMKVMQHLLLIQPFRILEEVMQATNSVATHTDTVMLVADSQHVVSNPFDRFDKLMLCFHRVPQTERNLTHMLILVLLGRTSRFMQRLAKR